MVSVGGLERSHLDTDIPLTLNRQTVPLQNGESVASSPDFRDEQTRLDTFRNWLPSFPVRPVDLARDGFVYTGPRDKVQCVYCRGILFNWESGDVVSDEHLKHQPHCPLKANQRSTNVHTSSNSGDSGYHSHIRSDSTSAPVAHFEESGKDIPPPIHFVETAEILTPVSVTPQHSLETHQSMSSLPGLGITPRINPKHPKYMLENERLKTFTTWPSEYPQKPEELAKAGFFYLGSGDKTKCFCCSGNLMNWEHGDNPFVEHAKWFSNCGYIKLIKGEDFVHDASNQRVENASAPSSISNYSTMGVTRNTAPEIELSALPPKVLAVMEHGYTREQIENALQKCKRSFNDFRDAEDLLTFMLESDTEMTFKPAGMSEEEVTEILMAEEPLSTREDTPSMTMTSSGETNRMKNVLTENQEMKEQLLCKICMEENACIVFLPCGHLVTCGSCAAALRSCPLCRKPIKGTVRTYFG